MHVPSGCVHCVKCELLIVVFPAAYSMHPVQLQTRGVGSFHGAQRGVGAHVLHEGLLHASPCPILVLLIAPLGGWSRQQPLLSAYHAYLDAFAPAQLVSTSLASFWHQSWIDSSSYVLRRMRLGVEQYPLTATALGEGANHGPLVEDDDASSRHGHQQARFLAASWQCLGLRAELVHAWLQCGCHPSCSCRVLYFACLGVLHEDGQYSAGHQDRSAYRNLSSVRASDSANGGDSGHDAMGFSIPVESDHMPWLWAACRGALGHPTVAHDYPSDDAPWYKPR